MGVSRCRTRHEGRTLSVGNEARGGANDPHVRGTLRLGCIRGLRDRPVAGWVLGTAVGSSGLVLGSVPFCAVVPALLYFGAENEVETVSEGRKEQNDA